MKPRILMAIDVILGYETPRKRGIQLAESVVMMDRWDNLQISLEGVPSNILIKPFFVAFLVQIARRSPARIHDARNLVWIPNYEFQRELIDRWMHEIEV